jgi:hypothetical protein
MKAAHSQEEQPQNGARRSATASQHVTVVRR